MSFLIVLLALGLLIFVAYRGHSVILFAPLAALLAVLLTEPALVAPVYAGVFMDKVAQFIKVYFPVFILGALFGKLIEISGYAKAAVRASVSVQSAKRPRQRSSSRMFIGPGSRTQPGTLGKASGIPIQAPCSPLRARGPSLQPPPQP